METCLEVFIWVILKKNIDEKFGKLQKVNLWFDVLWLGGHLYLKLDIILIKKNHVSRVVFQDQAMYAPRGGHLYFRLDIIRVKGLSKHTLNTYFSGMKIDPKYAFLHAVSSI